MNVCPIFTSDEWRSVFAAEPTQNLDDITHLTSPIDAVLIDTCRKKRAAHNDRESRRIQLDSFVFAKGEPRLRHCTKVGGVPFWPENMPLPSHESGEKSMFIGQLYLDDSTDVLPSLDYPGNVCLIFFDKYRHFFIEWQSVQESFRPLTSIGPEASPYAAYYGARWRSYDIVGSADLSTDIIRGTKLGGAFCLDDESLIADYDDLDFIGSLGSLRPRAGSSFPWINVKGSIPLDNAGYCVSHWDANEIQIYCDQEGEFHTCLGSPTPIRVKQLLGTEETIGMVWKR